MIIKHCPHCNASILFRSNVEPGTCWKCGKKYEVKIRLSKICLVKPYVSVNYEAEIIDFLSKNGKSYASEISRMIKHSPQAIRGHINYLVDQGILCEEQRGRTKWIKINPEACYVK
jgi:predicted HTH transcriptional regulator